jgi:iron complex transport system ATP-binding protein
MTLVADGLTLARGARPILAGVSATFGQGSITVILGPNGAGKSTLLEALAGLLPCAAGAVTLDGLPVQALDPRLPHRGAFAGLSAADRAAIAEALAAADLEGLADRRVQQLSGGERARALLARVLAGPPRVLLADEPLANLDPRHAQEALRLFRAAADGGAAVVLVLHDLQAAARAGDRLLLMAQGRCLAAGAPDSVLTPGLLGSAYGLDMRVWRDPDSGLIILPAG